MGRIDSNWVIVEFPTMAILVVLSLWSLAGVVPACAGRLKVSRRVTYSSLGTSLVLIGTLCMIVIRGTPSGWLSVTILALLGVLGGSIGWTDRRGIIWRSAAVVAILCVLSVVPVCHKDVDLTNAMKRDGTLGLMLFSHKTDTTELVWQYCGRRVPTWGNMGIYSCSFLGVKVLDIRDGGIGRDADSVVFDDKFHTLVDALPTDEDRVRVIACLTDHRNEARWHQSFLATALLLQLLREGAAPFEANWHRHARYFTPVRTKEDAREFTRGWELILAAYIDRQKDTAAQRRLAEQLPAAWSFASRGYSDAEIADFRLTGGRSVYGTSSCKECHSWPGRDAADSVLAFRKGWVRRR